MDKQKFLENVTKQFVDADKISLTLSTDFKNIESYDSLIGMAITVMIKDIYGVDMSISEYKSQETIENLFELVESKIIEE